MDRASIVILERTLELAAELLPQDARAVEYMDVIRTYLESPNTDSEARLQQAVAELLAIARQNQQFLIAARLQAFVRQHSDVA
jgi:CHASE3 domain sensor protein